MKFAFIAKHRGSGRQDAPRCIPSNAMSENGSALIPQ